MFRTGRAWFPYLLAVLAVGAVVYAVSFGRLPPADFRFWNGTEIKTVDPAIVTGAPEGRIIREIFECLVNWHPETLVPIPGVAESWEASEDLTTYRFQLRDNALWSDGTPVTAEDFHWSFHRFLHPGTAAEYAYQLWYVKGAEQYTKSQVEVGDDVEVELNEPIDDALPHARNQIVYGKLTAIEPGATEKDPTVYIVQTDQGTRRFKKDGSGDTTDYLWLLPDFRNVGIRVLDRLTLEIELKHPVPYFVQLMGFYPLSPVNRRCVETYGYPTWTKPENIVSNGPFLLAERRIRDRIRLVKNPKYWDHENVAFNVVDAVSIESYTTALNLYLTGELDWVYTVPHTILPELKGRHDFLREPYLATYFYRVNTTRPPMNDPRVRRALNLAMDKQDIIDSVARAGQLPASSLVPPGIAGYAPGTCGEYNVDEARRLLAEAGYPGGRGFPKIEILYNTADTHKAIAELLQSQWKRALGIDVGLVNQEWAAYLSRNRQLNYDVSRAGWIGDYADPNTFLDMFVTGGENNQTGWGNPRYDELIELAQQEPDPQTRLDYFHEAETILLDEMPIIPIYFYVSTQMVRPYVENFHTNIQDVHPIAAMRIDQKKKAEFLKKKDFR